MAYTVKITGTEVVLPTGAALAEFDGMCLELVDELLHRHPEGDILYVTLPRSHRWKYHAVLLLNGLVYDAWHPDVRLPPEEYVRKVFGPKATWEINPGAEYEEDE